MLVLTTTERDGLVRAANDAILDALSGRILGWATHPPAGEVDAVAAIVSVGLPCAALGWSSILHPRYRVEVAGVFCHQTPRVSFTRGSGTGKCELADLLVVIDDVTLSKTERRALLVQTKKAKHPTTKLTSAGDLVQLDLYQRRPVFQFYRGPYPRNPRDVTSPPGAAHEGFSYGLIDLLPSCVGWEQMVPSNPMTMGTGIRLGETVVDMMAGSAGREAFVGGADDWSDTIEVLLGITGVRKAGSYSPHRGVRTLTYFSSSLELRCMNFAGHPPPPDGAERDDEDGGINTVYVRLTHSEVADRKGEG